jgi:hypothetical protein
MLFDKTIAASELNKRIDAYTIKILVTDETAYVSGSTTHSMGAYVADLRYKPIIFTVKRSAAWSKIELEG